MSTNDLRKFPFNEYRKTILTTDKGRIIDLITVLNFKDDQIILTSDEFQIKVKAHLNKYTITDDVRLDLPEEKFYRIIIEGDDCRNIAESITGINPVLNIAYMINENDLLYADDFRFDSVNIICKQDSLDMYKDKLKAAGLTEQGSSEFEYMRIDAGLPDGENEFNENINPVECGLDKYISYNKGCYIGQEVIARLDSQGKKPKQMVKIRSGKLLDTGDNIYSGNKEAGFISSSVSYKGNDIALGFIRSVDLGFEEERNYSSGKSPEGAVKINIFNINTINKLIK